MIDYLDKTDIVEINLIQQAKLGGMLIGPENVKNPSPLLYLIDAARDDTWAPSLIEKATLYMFHIIKDHVFHDGNNRTGLLASYNFLSRNRVTVIPPHPDDEFDFARGVAICDFNKPEIADFLKKYTSFPEDMCTYCGSAIPSSHGTADALFCQVCHKPRDVA